MGLYRVLSPSKVSFFHCLCHNAQTIPSEVTVTSVLSGQFSWEMTRTLICFTSIYTGEGDGTPLQYSCLENPMDRGAW